MDSDIIEQLIWATVIVIVAGGLFVSCQATNSKRAESYANCLEAGHSPRDCEEWRVTLP
jgi:hypothetical protein